LLPVIIFSHGLGGSREGGELWGRHWAGHGYIVVHLQHPGSDESVWKGKQAAEAKRSLKQAMSLDNSRLRVGDVGFALDQIARLQAAAVAPFAQADLAHIGMSGHSFGAQTTLTVAGQQMPFAGAGSGRDGRITAAIAFSPNARFKIGSDRQFGDIRLPFFSITGSRDGSVLDDNTHAEDRIVPYLKMPPGNKYLVSFLDGDHMVFGGHALGARRPETARDREIQAGVKAATLAFWDANLKQDAVAGRWLQGDFKSLLIAGDRFEWK
jgi:predicted dienelactone hydrolase